MKELKDIFTNVKKSFSSLWHFKERGNAIEVITPYATTSAKFISVFISKQNDDFIVSDGGWIDGQIYDCILDLDDECFQKIHEHYIDSFEISQVSGLDDNIIYYKKTNSEKAVSSLILDLSTFISNLVSLAQIQFSDKEEKQSVKRFRKRANEYLRTFIDKKNLDTSGYFGDEKSIKCDAFVRTPNSRLILLNYITGSTNSHFTTSITKANFMFEMADKSKYKSYIKRKISVIDTSSNGYNPNKFAGFLAHLHENTNSIEVKWSEKSILKELISAN